jgi:UDP-GlcNAc:undecaprenyl-phosphate/decaprenyl-phosphate GlcNAc-1-phosphate transferase
MSLYGTPFILALSLSLGIILLFLLAPLFHRQVWRTGKRHEAKAHLSRLGGVAIIASFVFTILLDPNLFLSKAIIGLICGALLILVFGLWDDFFSQNWRIQLAFQVSIVLLMIIFGNRILSVAAPFGETIFLTTQALFFPSVILTLIWFLLVMNAMNWLDGLDGLAGGVSFLVLMTITVIALRPEVNQPPVAILALASAGAVLAFLLFNFYPARILLGTTGSLFLGFIIALLAIISGTKVATALMVLSLPITDAIWVIIDRLRHGRSIFQPDQSHLHYRLRDLGWSERRISWFFYGITALISFLALSTTLMSKFVAFILIICVLVGVLFFVQSASKQKK